MAFNNALSLLPDGAMFVVDETQCSPDPTELEFCPVSHFSADSSVIGKSTEPRSMQFDLAQVQEDDQEEVAVYLSPQSPFDPFCDRNNTMHRSWPTLEREVVVDGRPDTGSLPGEYLLGLRPQDSPTFPSLTDAQFVAGMADERDSVHSLFGPLSSHPIHLATPRESVSVTSEAGSSYSRGVSHLHSAHTFGYGSPAGEYQTNRLTFGTLPIIPPLDTRRKTRSPFRNEAQASEMVDPPNPHPKDDLSSDTPIPALSETLSRVPSKFSTWSRRRRSLHDMHISRLFMNGQDKAMKVLGVSPDLSATNYTPSLMSYEVQSHNEEVQPLKGLRLWLLIVAAQFTAFNAMGLVTSFGVFQAYYKTVFSPSTPLSHISCIGSVQAFLALATAVLVAQAVGRGHLRHVFASGSIIQVGALLLLSNCVKFWQVFCVQGLALGLGSGAMVGACLTLMQPVAGSGTALAGNLNIGASAGGIVVPFILRALVVKTGFSWAVRVIALVVFMLIIYVNMVLPSGEVNDSKQTKDNTLSELLHDTPFLLLILGIFLASFSILILPFQLPLSAISIAHVPLLPALDLLVILNAAAIPGGAIPTLVAASCIGPLNTVIPLTLCTALVAFLWISSTTHASFILVTIFYGLGLGGVISILTSIVGFYFGDKQKKHRFVVIMIIIAVGVLIGPPIAGRLVEIGNGKLLYAQVLAGTTMVLAAVALTMARVSRIGMAAERI